MKSILDPRFRYINAASTDIRKTFARVRREQRRERVQAQAPVAPLLLFHRKETQR